MAFAKESPLLETANFLFYTRLLEAKAKPLAAALGFAEAWAYRAANPKATGKNPAWRLPDLPLASLWTEGVPAKARGPYAAYVIDYMAFGPLAEQFPTFIGALRPDENERLPA